jgi:hypothetical protein
MPILEACYSKGHLMRFIALTKTYAQIISSPTNNNITLCSNIHDIQKLEEIWGVSDKSSQNFMTGSIWFLRYLRDISPACPSSEDNIFRVFPIPSFFAYLAIHNHSNSVYRQL